MDDSSIYGSDLLFSQPSVDEAEIANGFCSPEKEYEALYRSAIRILTQPLPETSEVEESFRILLENCSSCLEYALNTIEDNDCNVETVISYINNFVTMLSNLRSYLDNAQEVLTLNCEEFQTLPIAVANILLKLFKYCKDSESIYSDKIAKLRTPLKDLFQCCNNLHLTYMVIIEKHFSFDLEEEDQLEVLVEVLNTNVLIGQVVTDLNVKTMAEHWKGFTAICERFCDDLRGKFDIADLANLLCGIIVRNVEEVVKTNIQPNLLAKKLKVTNFILRILSKVFQIFRLSLPAHLGEVCQCLCLLYGYSDYYIVSIGGSDELARSMKNLMDGAEPLVNLLTESSLFAQALFQINFEQNDIKNLGLALLLTGIQTQILLIQDDSLKKIWLKNTQEENICCKIIHLVQQCNKWLMSDMTLELIVKKRQHPISFGLYEYLLVHTSSLSLSVDHEGYSVIEKCLIESLLSSNIWRALFANDLWAVITMYTPTSLTLQLIEYLIPTLESIKLSDYYYGRPQPLSVASLLQRLFNRLPDGSKSELLAKYPLEMFRETWIAIQLCNLPEKLKASVQETQLKLLSQTIEDFNNSAFDGNELNNMIELLRLCSTCDTTQNQPELAENLMKLWFAAASAASAASTNQDERITSDEWFNQFVISLGQCTENRLQTFRSDFTYQVLDILHNMLQLSNSSTKVAALSFILHLSTGEHEDFIYCKIAELFTELMKCEKVKMKAFTIFGLFCKHTPKGATFNQNISEYLQNEFVEFLKDNKLILNDEYDFKHVCAISEDIFNSKHNLRDFADFDGIFEESERPNPKRLKTSSDEVLNTLVRIEKDVSILVELQQDFDLESKNRISEVCVMLTSLIKD